jgi:hypothetical protein
MWHVNLWGQFCVLGYQLALDKLYINYTCITILSDRAFNYLQPVTTDIDLFLFALHLDAYTRSVAWWGERWYQWRRCNMWWWFGWMIPSPSAYVCSQVEGQNLQIVSHRPRAALPAGRSPTETSAPNQLTQFRIYFRSHPKAATFLELRTIKRIRSALWYQFMMFRD